MTALLITGTYSTLMLLYPDVCRHHSKVNRVGEGAVFWRSRLVYRGRELFEATPILRPVTSYRAIGCLHVTTLEGPRKARSVSPDCGGGDA